MKKTIIFLSLLTAAMLLAACGKDFLTREPKLQQSTELTLSTYDGLNKATLGAYFYLASTGWYGSDRIIDAEMRSGNGVKSSFKNSNRCTQAYNWNYTEDNTNTAMWAYCYYTAALANNVIDNLEGKESATVSEQDLNNLKAECLFLRALAHFDNVLQFGQPYSYVKNNNLGDDLKGLGVPYIYHTDANDQSPRLSVLKVYENVAEDLLEAERIIDPAYQRKGITDSRAAVNQLTIQALLSRVYLYMEEWQNAANYATKVISSEKYSMWTAEEYPEAWGNDLGSGEVIFEIYGKRTNDTYGSWDDISYLTSPNGYGDPQVAPSLYNMFEEGDVRLKTIVTDDKNESGCYWTAKYPGKGDNAAPDCNNVIVLRLSEMYLNRAEALVKGASIPGVTAISDLNTITSNRGAAAYTSVGMLDIRTERRKELAFEGHYFYDLARWGQALVRSNEDFVLGSTNQNVEFPSYRWALPIPKRELEVNKNLRQNDGYTDTSSK